ncbi:MAG: DUF6526 family protein [Pyrinomonadaceae bacterium]
MQETQNYKNHARYYPLVHFVLFPILSFNLIWQSVRLYQEPNWDRAENVLLAVAFIFLNVAARLQALRAQDRVIRLEESLRYRRILPEDLAAQAENLPTGKIVALRFASDHELTDLVSRTLNGEFKNPKEIKLAIKNWRGDYLRV